MGVVEDPQHFASSATSQQLQLQKPVKPHSHHFLWAPGFPQHTAAHFEVVGLGAVFVASGVVLSLGITVHGLA